MKILSNKELLESTIVQMLSSEQERRYYGYFLMNMKRSFTDRIDTAGVRLTTQGIDLIINPQFFASLTNMQRMQVLEHECKHVTNLHMIRYGDREDHYLKNIAADLAINDPLESLHELGVTAEKINRQYKDKLDAPLEKNKSFEYYYQKLYKLREEVKKDFDTVDDHSEWEKSEGMNEEIAKAKIGEAMKKASNSVGVSNTPSDILMAIQNLFKPSVNWKSQLKMFLTNSKSIYKEGTRRKRNRRYGFQVPGKRKKYEPNLAICVDTSGSVSDDYLCQFFSEIDKMMDDVEKLWIIEADSVVQKFYEYHKGQKIEIKGRGGTAYNPAIEKSIELGVDGIIYFGDGDCFDEIVKKPKVPFLWAMIDGCEPPASWGKKCQVKIVE